MKGRPFHPFLFSFFPPLSLYSQNLGNSSWGDLAAVLGVLAVLCILSIAVWYALTRSLERSALIVSFVAVITLLHVHGHVLLQHLPVELRYRHYFLAWAVVAAGGTLWLWRSRMDLVKATLQANLVSAALIVGAGSFIAIRLLGIGAEGVPREQVASHVAMDPIEARSLATPKRDIYYLVFDRYAGDAEIRHEYQFDNSEFYRALESRGFYVDRKSRANYPMSVLSMASALNCTYHPNTILPKAEYANLLREHRVGKFLKRLGYQYLFVGNWAKPFRENAGADRSYLYTALPSELADTIYNRTPFGRFFPLGHLDVRWQLDAIPKLAAEPSPKFVYSHFLIPHKPWNFDRDGSRLSPVTAVGRETDENYLNQLIFTNGEILKMVDALLADADNDPIIILQSDEGPYLTGPDALQPHAEQMRKRTGILTALHFPEVDVAENAPRPMSPVNTFRFLLSEYFGAELEPLPFRSFYWDGPEISKNYPDGKNYLPKAGKEFVEITHLLDPGPIAGGPRAANSLEHDRR